ncbi:hypothetical protein B0T21DRAFT_390088 [Apiosordaria backusii]|uniref:Uncharacterized protein n=1 Tax=Apiosordaria backusii TaxID=314023 RepID=A0AA40ESU1_9PEZI|nr:hypothetical protein B0T21DRAFT_390088 [Apiosordaria backusii]
MAGLPDVQCVPVGWRRAMSLLLLSSLLDLSHAHILQPRPRRTPDAPPTTTLPYHPLSVISWPLRPTPPPRDLFALRRRQENTVCGYLGGDQNLAATCSAGSHCVLDTENNVVGCCPNGEASCTAGVFTGCVDANSGPQTEVNPYVFTCGGGDVCYKNVFQGGASQFGCGSASDLATIVLTSASGLTTQVTFPTISLSLTQAVSTLSEPTTLGTVTSSVSSSTESDSTSSSTSSSSSTSTTSPPSSTQSSTRSSTTTTPTTTETASPATDAPEAGQPQPTNRTGLIVGATIGGLAVLIALVALLAFCLRRRQNANNNSRSGPGKGSMIRGQNISTPRPGPGTGFTAIPQNTGAFETGPSPNPMFSGGQYQGQGQQPQQQQQQMKSIPLLTAVQTSPRMPFQSDISPIGPQDDVSPYAYSAGAGGGGAVSAVTPHSHTSYPPSEELSLEYRYLQQQGLGQGGYPAIYNGAAAIPVIHGVDSRLESDQVPLTREIDDFSHGFSAALGRIGEEDEEDHLRREEEGEGVDELGEMNMASGGRRQQEGMMSGGENEGDRAASSVYSRGSNGGGRPLWQQNRRQSRNLMWM